MDQKSPQSLPTIEPQNLRGQIETELRKAILHGVFQPGERVVESVIASQMGVSRAPVREVLSALEREGLVVNVPRRGNFVVSFDEKDIEEIYSLRLWMEIGAVRRAISRINQEDIDRMQKIVDQLGDAVIHQEDPDSIIELDLSFHGYYFQVADHSRMLAIWNSIRAQTSLLIGLTSKTHYEYPEHPKELHQLILDAIMRRDSREAEGQLTKHILDAEQRAYQALRELAKYTETT